MARPCHGCDLVPEEISTVAQILVGARNRDRWDFVDEAIDRLRELARRAAAVAQARPPRERSYP